MLNKKATKFSEVVIAAFDSQYHSSSNGVDFDAVRWIRNCRLKENILYFYK